MCVTDLESLTGGRLLDGGYDTSMLNCSQYVRGNPPLETFTWSLYSVTRSGAEQENMAVLRCVAKNAFGEHIY